MYRVQAHHIVNQPMLNRPHDLSTPTKKTTLFWFYHFYEENIKLCRICIIPSSESVSEHLVTCTSPPLTTKSHSQPLFTPLSSTCETSHLKLSLHLESPDTDQVPFQITCLIPSLSFKEGRKYVTKLYDS